MADKPTATLQDFIAQLTNWDAAWSTAQPIGYSFYQQAYAVLGPQPGFSAFTPLQRTATARALAGISDVANISFVNVGDNGQRPGQGNERISLFNINYSQAFFWGALIRFETQSETVPLGRIFGAEIVVNNHRAIPQGGWEIGESNPRKLLHELLHAVGLDHAGPYNGDGPTYENNAIFFQDSIQYTVMSYWAASKTGANHAADGLFYHASTPLLYDIAALQALYGANMETRKGDTVYGFNSTAGRAEFDFLANPRPVVAIWDAGGTDTIDLSGYSVPSLINLNAGEFSDVGGLTKNLAIAYGATIEDVVGGSAADTIIGNEVANFVDLSRGGDDWASGGAGADAFYFGAAFTAADRVDGGTDGDQLGLQGHYAGLTLAAESLVGVETLALLSGTDTRFGHPGAGPDARFSYDIKTADETVASGQQLVVQAGLLVSGERFVFDGSAETNGTFLTYGGKGEDWITGGGLSDGFYFGAGAFTAGDRVDGGGGDNDQLALRGDYSAGLVLSAESMKNVEALVFLSASDVRFGQKGASYGYNVTSHEGNVAAGQILVVTAALLEAGEALTFDGSSESDGRFRILGGKGDDRLTSGSGNDVLYGGLGADVLAGGGGSDTFLYRAAIESAAGAADLILLFAAGDHIDLSALDADSGTAANEAFSFLGAAPFSGVAGQLRAYQEGSAWIVAGDVDGDGIADLLMNVETAPGHLLGSGDFLF